MTAPILGKQPPEPRDFRPMSWWIFLALREWAQTVADAEQANVYLVGSVLTKINPRDIDVSIVLPRDVFEARFGPLPDDPSPEAHRELWRRTEQAKVNHWLGAQKAVEDIVRVDVKFSPDCWWPDRDRLLLAAPITSLQAAHEARDAARESANVQGDS